VKKTGINPIMHVLSIRKEVVVRHPDLPRQSLTRLSWKRAIVATSTCRLKKSPAIKKNGTCSAKIPYDYVMGENEKRTLAAMNRYQIEQG
jgi:hypothetical protein